jgi:hypothetical protein
LEHDLVSGACGGSFLIKFRPSSENNMLEVPTSAELHPEQLAAVRAHLQEVLSSGAFLGSHRAQVFLQVVVEHALAGRMDCLRERMLGAELFGRPIDYDTGNDSVVRVKASDVRRRLAEYYQSRSTRPTVQIEIPSGSYTPHFHWVPEEAPLAPSVPAISLANSVEIPKQPEAGYTTSAAFVPRLKWKPWIFRAALVAAYSAVLLSLGWFAAIRFSAPRRTPKATDPIWSALFDGKRDTYIVPADIGFDLLEDLSHHPINLADYLKGGYVDLPLPGVNAHIAEGLRSQRLTSFVDAQIIASLARLPEYNPQRTFLRFPRDLRLDDLKDADAIFIGSVGSNPWVAIADNGANFHIVYRQGREGATIINEHPQPGEQATYESHWNEPAHETFALIAFLPNMSGNGHLLLLQGLDVAGTQAAAEALFHSAAVAPVLKRATRPDGSIQFLEILVRSTSINWNSTDVQVIASRIH